MDSDLLHSPAMGLTEEEEADMNDWKLPLAFMKKRHSEKIEGSKALAQSWRMKDRVDRGLKNVKACKHFWPVFILALIVNVEHDTCGLTANKPEPRPCSSAVVCTQSPTGSGIIYHNVPDKFIHVL
ncbi:hypothetical protein PAMP_020485 [Pampus punctatissimus]